MTTVRTGHGGDVIDVLKEVVRTDWQRWLRADPSPNRRSRATKAMSMLEEPLPPTLDTAERWHVPVSIGETTQIWHIEYQDGDTPSAIQQQALDEAMQAVALRHTESRFVW